MIEGFNYMNYIVVAYYTIDTLYELHVKVLRKSLHKFNLPHHIQPVDSLGNWNKNCNYKPTFLKQMMKEYFPLSIVYVDCDAEFVRHPILFDSLDCNIGLFELDKRKYYPQREYKKGVEYKETCSGTIFLNNNLKVMSLLDLWERECEEHRGQWDQRNLQNVICNDFYRLPPEYCCIDGTMNMIQNPVIVHHQASRKVRKNKGRLVLA